MSSQHEIYVSYAEANEDWVIQLIKQLKSDLKGFLGKIDKNFIWAKYLLKGADDKILTPKKHLAQSKILLVVLSPAYIREGLEQELIDFIEKTDENAERIFVIEYSETERPDQVKNIVGYKFWYEDDREKEQLIITGSEKYFKTVRNIAYDLVEKIKDLEEQKQQIDEKVCSIDPIACALKIEKALAEKIEKEIQEIKQSTKKVEKSPKIIEEKETEIQPYPVFIDAVPENIELAYQVRLKLLDNGINSNICSYLSPKESARDIRENFQKKLQFCQGIIMLCDKAPLEWITARQRSYVSMLAFRDKPFKVIAILSNSDINLKDFKIPNVHDIILKCQSLSDHLCFQQFMEILQK